MPNICNQRGQATTELVFLLPALILLIGGGIGIIYVGQQSLKVQEAANVAARIQGQERVGGGKSFDSIREQNGQDQGSGIDPAGLYADNGNPDDAPQMPQGNASSVYRRLFDVAKKMFGTQDRGLAIPRPMIGQNVDEVHVVKTIRMPKIPFINQSSEDRNKKVIGRAWGGEDTFMYGLPRWGKTNNVDKEWQRLIKESKVSADQH